MPQDRTSILDPHKKEIIELLSLGVTQVKIAEKFKVHRNTLKHFMANNGLKRK